MRALLVSDNPDLKELLSFQVSTEHPVTVKECLSARDGAELLKKEEFAFLIAPYNGAESILVKVLRGTKDPVPVIFYYDPMITVPKENDLLGLAVIGTVNISDLPEGVNRLIKDFVGKGGGHESTSEFCPIRTTLLIRATPLQSDIYIRLSADKFVKLFRSGDVFDSSDLKRYYEAKGVEYMYLKRTETTDFLAKFRKELDALLARDDLSKLDVIDASEMSQEAIQELIQNVGFNEEVQELAKKNVQLTLKSIGSEPRLSELILLVTKQGNYLSQHSTLLAHIACCVAKEMEWGSDSTFSKLVLAAFMHDVAVNDPELARLNSLKDLQARKSEFPPEEAKNYHLHPAKAADVIRSFKEIPSDVDVIVQQHHERPNGSGFPRGLMFNYIAPLSALFIMSHELTTEILRDPVGFSMERFVAEKKPFFNQGNFKKVIATLEKVKV